LPDFLHYGHDGRQKNAITQDRSVKTMWAWEAAHGLALHCAFLGSASALFLTVPRA
jgi:hypothetical protein